jgi:hypothetical protein
MAKVLPAKAAERKYGILITNHKPEYCQVTLTESELSQHACLRRHDVRTLLRQDPSPLFEDCGIEISAACRQPGCPHQK